MRILINDTRIFNICLIFVCLMMSSCKGKGVSEDKVEPQVSGSAIDADGDWRLVSYRVGHETRVYGKSNDYILSFSDEDMSFDFTLNNDTVDGDYSVVDDTIRFSADSTENEHHDEVLMMVSNVDCVGTQDNDSLILMLPDDCMAVFTRIK